MSKSVTVNTAEELGKALADKADEIRIEGDCALQVRHIRTMSPIRWVAAYSALVLAVSSVLVVRPFAPLGIAEAILGYDAAVTAISIGVAAKSARVLKVLRKDYIEVARGPDYLVLKRK